jgi:putative exosortase-associated protein (TIGR04073 family)
MYGRETKTQKRREDMALRKNKLVRAALLVGLAAGTAIMTGCTLWKSMDGAERVPEESFSLKGAGVQLSRGTVNMGMCWLEIPYNMEKEVQKADDNALSFALAGASGAVFGTVQGANRIVGGVFEILFSPFPPYGPIMCPGWPPYLGPKTPKPSGDDGKSQGSGKPETPKNQSGGVFDVKIQEDGGKKDGGN